jgi:hypothetical protein
LLLVYYQSKYLTVNDLGKLLGSKKLSSYYEEWKYGGMSGGFLLEMGEKLIR